MARSYNPVSIFRRPRGQSTLGASPAIADIPYMRNFNLARVGYVRTQIIWNDAKKQSDMWKVQNASNFANQYSTSTDHLARVNQICDANGWPIQAIPYVDPTGVKADAVLHCEMLAVQSGGFPSGNWTLSWKGDGDIRLGHDATGTYVGHGGTNIVIVPVSTPAQGVTLRIIRSNPADPVRDVKFLSPGTADTNDAQPFYQPFLDRLGECDGLRFMNFMNTNDSRLIEWGQRCTFGYHTQANPYGASLEWACILANTLGVVPWFCVPHQANEDFIRRMMQVIRDWLTTGRRFVLENSNEVWNGSFEQKEYAEEQGQLLGFDVDATAAGRKWNAYKSALIFKIMEEVFGSAASSAIKALCGQASVGAVLADTITAFNDVTYNPTLRTFNLAACAFYFGNGLADDVDPDATTAAAILDELEATYVPLTLTRIDDLEAIATSAGVEFAAYEGGPYLLANEGANQANATLTAKLHEAKRHSRLYGIYRTVLDYFEAAGGCMWNQYNFCDALTNVNTFGALENLEIEVDDSPVYRALFEIASLTQIGGALSGMSPFGLFGRLGSFEITANLMTTANRTSGPAPLGVRFDGTADVDIGLPPLHPDRGAELDKNGAAKPGRRWSQYHFRWTFGQPGYVHSKTGHDANVGFGYQGAVKYTEIGQHVCTCYRTDESGVTDVFTQTITVDDPDITFAGDATMHVDFLDGSDANDGDDPAAPKQILEGLKTWMLSGNGPRRIKCKFDQSHAVLTQWDFSGLTGPFRFEKWGAGTNPTMNVSNVNGVVFEGDESSSEVSFVDIDFNGDPDSSNGSSVMDPGQWWTWIGGTVTNCNHGAEATGGIARNNSFLYGITIEIVGSYGVYWNHGLGVVIMNCSFDGVHATLGEHCIRCYITHALIAYCLFNGGRTAKNQLKFVGYFPIGDVNRDGTEETLYVEFTCIMYCEFRGHAGDWNCGVGPVDSGKDQRHQDILIEGCLGVCTAATDAMFYLQGNYSCIRNCRINGAGFANVKGIHVTRRNGSSGIEPNPTGWEVLNNSCGSTAAMRAIVLHGTATNTTCINNLLSCPGGTMIQGTGTGLTQSNNINTATACFVSLAGDNFHLVAGTPAENAGLECSEVKFDTDFEALDASPDCGAYQFV